MRMVRTGHLHFALGIELAGVGGYMGMTVLYFSESGIATASDLSVERHSRVTVLCGAFKGPPGRPSFQRMPGRPITANRKGLLLGTADEDLVQDG
jgi:hypothetical protein